MLSRGIAKFIIMVLFKVALLLSIPFALFYIYGVKEALNPLLIYLQFLIFWAQAEIGMRQFALVRFQSEPSFDVEREIGGMHIADKTQITNENLKIKNISEWPAYDIILSRVLDDKFSPIPPDEWRKWLSTKWISCLPPHKERVLCSWNPNKVPHDYFEQVAFEILYRNRFGDLRTLRIRFLSGGEIVLFHEEPPRSGWLLRTLEELSLLFKMGKFHMFIRKRQDRFKGGER